MPAVGAGAALYGAPSTADRASPTACPVDQSAAALARLAAEKLAKGEEFLPPRPLYLRRPDARVPTNYKVVTPK